MGMSIGSDRGVAVPDRRLVGCIDDSNRAAACAIIIHCIAAAFEYQRIATDESVTRGGGRLAHVFAGLTTDTPLEVLHAMLLAVTKVPYDPEEFGDTFVLFGDLAIDLWSELLRELHPMAPAPASVIVLRNPRQQGYDLEPDVVHFIFSERDCVKTVKTANGKALDDAIGLRTKVSTWTDVSI